MDDGIQSTGLSDINDTRKNIIAAEALRNPLPHPCPHCHKSFWKNAVLNKHIKCLHPEVIEKPYQCNACPKAFQYRSELKRHLEVHSSYKSHNCPNCEFNCKSERSLRSHLTRHEENRERFKCSICRKEYSWKTDLTRHSKRAHGILNSEASIVSDITQENNKKEVGAEHKWNKMEDGNRKYRLSRDNATVSNMAAAETIQAPLPHSCPHCNQSFWKIAVLNEHIRWLHPEVIKKPFQCHACPRVYAYSSHLKQHVQYAHSNAKPLKCPKCDHGCKFICDLNKHLKTHEDNRETFKCSNCDNEYLTKNGLKYHLKREHVGSLNNNGSTKIENSKTRCQEELKHDEAKGGIMGEAPENIPISEGQDVQKRPVRGDHPTSTAAGCTTSERTEHEFVLVMWKCNCGNLYASEDDLRKHCVKDH